MCLTVRKPSLVQFLFGKRVRVINGGRGAYGANGVEGTVIERMPEDLIAREKREDRLLYAGSTSMLGAELYIQMDDGFIWGLELGCEVIPLEETDLAALN